MKIDAATAFWEGLRKSDKYYDKTRSPVLRHTCECTTVTVNVTVKPDSVPVYTCGECGAEWEAGWTVTGEDFKKDEP